MYENAFMRRTWAEINLTIINENIKTYISNRKGKTKVIAVVKADAYGHGDVAVALSLQKSGIDMFAVSNVYEAIALRNAGICGEILVLGYTPVECVSLLHKYNITQTIISYDYAQSLRKVSHKRLRCHIAIDTGMNRIGLNSKQLNVCIKQIEECASNFLVEGIFTHLCIADSVYEQDKEFTNLQIERFRKVVDGVKHLNLKYVHCLNSAGGISCANIDDDLGEIVRLGIIMYGLNPSSDFCIPTGITPALSWKTVVSMVKNVEKGESIGYGRSYIATKSMKVATLPVGYADGYNRLLSNKGYVLINGKKAPIVGRVCMDQMMVDISHIDNVSVGDEVILIGKSDNEVITADDMANLVNTIGYEIICAISKRVPRVYTN